MDAQRFYDDVSRRLDLADRHQAVRAAEACLVALHLRMREEAAERVAALLAPELRELWMHGGEELKRSRGAVSDFSRLQFLNYVGDRLGVREYHRAERIVRGTFEVLREHVPGADAVVRAELPEDIRELWSGLAARPP